jgi:hypothetical protein
VATSAAREAEATG